MTTATCDQALLDVSELTGLDSLAERVNAFIHACEVGSDEDIEAQSVDLYRDIEAVQAEAEPGSREWQELSALQKVVSDYFPDVVILVRG